MKNQKAKHVIISVFTAVILILCVLTVIWGLLSIRDYEARKKILLEKPVSVNQEYNADSGYDPDTDDEYLQQNLYISYTDHTGGVTNIITDGDYSNYGEDLVFFDKYFSVLRSGDYMNYDSMFTEAYFENAERTDTEFGFTKQSIYDIEIAYAKKFSSAGRDYSVYEVKYKILKNDGSFRGDIGSRQYRPQYFTLVSHGDTVKIERITYAYDPDFDFSATAMLFEKLCTLIAALIAVATVAVTVIRIKKKKSA